MIPTSKRMVSLPPSLVILPKTVSLYVWLLFQGWHGRARRSRSANRLLRWSGTIARVAVTIRTTVLNLISIIDIIRSMSSSLSIQWIRNLMTYSVTVRCFHPSTYARAKGEWSPPPSTSYTTDGTGANGWPCYTPPGTATSGTTSTGTGLSASGSPVFPNVGSYKSDVDDPYYHNTSSDIDQFSFNVPIVTPLYAMRLFIPSALSLPNHTPFSGSSSSAYLGQTFTTVSPLIVSLGEHDFDGCPQFGENCHGAYQWRRVGLMEFKLISLVIHDTILNYNYRISMYFPCNFM